MLTAKKTYCIPYSFYYLYYFIIAKLKATSETISNVTTTMYACVKTGCSLGTETIGESTITVSKCCTTNYCNSAAQSFNIVSIVYSSFLFATCILLLLS